MWPCGWVAHLWVSCLKKLRVRIEGFTYELVVVCDEVEDVSIALRNHYFGITSLEDSTRSLLQPTITTST